MNLEQENPQPPPLPSSGRVAGYCRACGKPLDEASIRTSGGVIYCQEHVPMDTAQGGSSPYTYTAPPYATANPDAVVNRDVSPGLAFLLGFVPGVGAIYNGQYLKGLVHVAIIGLIISILSSGDAAHLEPLLALILTAFWFYMPFEAFHTAKRRRAGLAVDETSGLFQPRATPRSKFPAAPVLLIAIGLVLLLDNLGLLDLGRALRFWPALLIVAGIYMLYARLGASGEAK